MRVKLQADPVGRRVDLALVRAAAHQRGHLLVVARQKHILLREVQNVYRVVRHVVPVDEFVHYVAVRLKRQHVSDDLNGELLLLREPLHLRQLTEVVKRVGTVLGRLFGSRLHAGKALPKPVHLPELLYMIRLQVDIARYIGCVSAAVVPLSVLSLERFFLPHPSSSYS